MINQRYNPYLIMQTFSKIIQLYFSTNARHNNCTYIAKNSNMENFIVNHNGQLTQVAPVLQEMDCYFAIDLYTREGVWIDCKTGEVKEDAEVAGID